jgi:hypothetical protein
VLISSELLYMHNFFNGTVVYTWYIVDAHKAWLLCSVPGQQMEILTNSIKPYGCLILK